MFFTYTVYIEFRHQKNTSKKPVLAWEREARLELEGNAKTATIFPEFHTLCKPFCVNPLKSYKDYEIYIPKQYPRTHLKTFFSICYQNLDFYAKLWSKASPEGAKDLQKRSKMLPKTSKNTPRRHPGTPSERDLEKSMIFGRF